MTAESRTEATIKSIPFARYVGLKVISATPELVVAEVKVREELTTGVGTMHGGAIMSLADTLGAVGTMANLPKGATTTTIESKTNFFAGIPLGDTARAECTPLHLGRTTMVWQTRITRGDGKTAALVIQTQLVMPPRGEGV